MFDRTPPKLLVEVVLVDDCSDWPIPADILAMEKVVAVKLPKREGLIRARTVGAQLARGEVSEQKCQPYGALYGWPLIQTEPI